MWMIRRAFAALAVAAASSLALRAFGGESLPRQSGGWRPLVKPDLK